MFEETAKASSPGQSNPKLSVIVNQQMKAIRNGGDGNFVHNKNPSMSRLIDFASNSSSHRNTGQYADFHARNSCNFDSRSEGNGTIYGSRSNGSYCDSYGRHAVNNRNRISKPCYVDGSGSGRPTSNNIPMLNRCGLSRQIYNNISCHLNNYVSTSRPTGSTTSRMEHGPYPYTNYNMQAQIDFCKNVAKFTSMPFNFGPHNAWKKFD